MLRPVSVLTVGGSSASPRNKTPAFTSKTEKELRAGGDRRKQKGAGKNGGRSRHHRRVVHCLCTSLVFLSELRARKAKGGGGTRKKIRKILF